MNIRVTPQELDRAAPNRWRKIRFQPRLDVLDEVVAGLLWVQLDLPDDISRVEIESVARRLVARIKADGDQTAIENELTILQRDQFCRPANQAAIRDLAQRSMMAVKGP
jgi:hypothetical protein